MTKSPVRVVLWIARVPSLAMILSSSRVCRARGVTHFGRRLRVLFITLIAVGFGCGSAVVSKAAEFGAGGGLSSPYQYPVTESYTASMAGAWGSLEWRSGSGQGGFVGAGAAHLWYRRKLIVSMGVPYQPETRLGVTTLAAIVGLGGKSRYHRATTLRAELWGGASRVTLREWDTTHDRLVEPSSVRWRPSGAVFLGARWSSRSVELGVRGGALIVARIGGAVAGNFTDEDYPAAVQWLGGVEMAYRP